MPAAASGLLNVHGPKGAAACGNLPAVGADGAGFAAAGRRSRSPMGRTGAISTPRQKGHTVQFFHVADASLPNTALVRQAWSDREPRLLLSHGWLEGTLQEAFDPEGFDESKQATWPLVLPRPDLPFETRTGHKPPPCAFGPRRVALQRVREPSARPPLLSLALVRWGGAYAKWMDEQESNDGDWGTYGSPPSDEYMTALVKMGILEHPRLQNDMGYPYSVEVLALFVTSSEDVWAMAPAAPWLAARLRGKTKTMFWMLWPAEWEDTGDPDFACYVERQALFGAMRACEAAGLRSGFPHPADQFELITSKTWMATLALTPASRLPAAVLVTKESVVCDARLAASDALAGLERIRAMNPCPVAPGDPPAPSATNRDGVKKGVVKLGWSWENRFVSVFVGLGQLQTRLVDMMSQKGCTASSCIVQEWVDFDFEMRLYFLPPAGWEAQRANPLQPRRIECNEWGARSSEATVGNSHASFTKLTEAMCLQRWLQDREAWESAKAQAIDASQFLLAWLVSVNARPVPMIRLDFMLKRCRQGLARVFFGEYCEMGACCLGWKEGPPTIWRAAIDAALR